MTNLAQTDAPASAPEEIKSEAAAPTATAAGAPAYDIDALLSQAPVDTGSRPAMSPPDDPGIAEQEQGISAWHNNKKITAMWCNSSNRNAFAAVEGLGWRKIADTNDSSFLSMVMLASHAETTNATVNVNIDTDNEIHQIYVW